MKDAEQLAVHEDIREAENQVGPLGLGSAVLPVAAVAWAAAMIRPRPFEEWHEDFGNVLWWRFPVEEPPYVGGPLDSDWPGCHTHWTPIPLPEYPDRAYP